MLPCDIYVYQGNLPSEFGKEIRRKIHPIGKQYWKLLLVEDEDGPWFAFEFDEERVTGWSFLLKPAKLYEIYRFLRCLQEADEVSGEKLAWDWYGDNGLEVYIEGYYLSNLIFRELVYNPENIDEVEEERLSYISLEKAITMLDDAYSIFCFEEKGPQTEMQKFLRRVKDYGC